MSRAVVAWAVFVGVFSALFGWFGSANGFYLHDPGVTVYGFEAFWRVGLIAVATWTGLTILAVLAIGLLSWVMEDEC